MPSDSRLAIPCWLLLLSFSGCGQSHLDELVNTARTGTIEEQRTALREIAELGADATPAVPVLIELSGHTHADVRRLSSLALGNIAQALAPVDRGDIVTVLTQQLDDKELAVRNTAAFALLALDPEQTRAQQHLSRAMQQGDGGIIDRLSRTQPPPSWAVPTLINILSRDRRPGIRRLAAVALGNIQPGHDATQTALQHALKDSDDRVRTAAQEALQHLQ